MQYQLLHRLALLAAVYGNYDVFRNQAGPAERNDYGGQIEAGYFVTRRSSRSCATRSPS